MTRARASPRKTRCRVCLLLPASEAALITGGLLAGWSARAIALRFVNVTRGDVTKHRTCLAKMLAKEEECR